MDNPKPTMYLMEENTVNRILISLDNSPTLGHKEFKDMTNFIKGNITLYEEPPKVKNPEPNGKEKK